MKEEKYVGVDAIVVVNGKIDSVLGEKEWDEARGGMSARDRLKTD